MKRGKFVPSGTDRVDATAPVARTRGNLVRPESNIDHGVEIRVDTSGKSGQPNKRTVRRLMRHGQPPEAAGRVDTHKPARRAPLNAEGRMNRSAPLPYHRELRFVDTTVEEHLTVMGGMWQVRHDVYLAPDGASKVPVMMHWGPADTSIMVPAGSLAVYAGINRTDAKKINDEDVIVRSLQHLFIINGKRCCVWDFSMISPVTDDDDDSDDGETTQE